MAGATHVVARLRTAPYEGVPGEDQFFTDSKAGDDTAVIPSERIRRGTVPLLATTSGPDRRFCLPVARATIRFRKSINQVCRIKNLSPLAWGEKAYVARCLRNAGALRSGSARQRWSEIRPDGCSHWRRRQYCGRIVHRRRCPTSGRTASQTEGRMYLSYRCTCH